jgi:hypothetical protein
MSTTTTNPSNTANIPYGFSQQAFPTWVADDSMMPGMALVDYFATQALAIASKDTHNHFEAARIAYEMAGAMMVARHEYHKKHHVHAAPSAP